MSYVLATPEMMAAAATNLAQIGSALSAANATALAQTTAVPAADADELSAAVASLFFGHTRRLARRRRRFMSGLSRP
ncbi:Conserved protein of unknown function, PE_PGRS family protein (fragment) [Mycobacterium canettii CIPT 140070010]